MIIAGKPKNCSPKSGKTRTKFMHSSFDIIIIGAGPAGISAALSAVQRKPMLGIGIIDRKKQPGFPVRCGEAIGLKGFSSYISLRKEWIKSSISATKLVSPSGIVVSIPVEQRENFIIDREKMESDLLSEAVDKGVAYISDTTIISAAKYGDRRYQCRGNSGEVFEASCCIVADGVESKAARFFGWDTFLAPSDVFSCAFARIDHDAIEPGACFFYLGRSVAPGGYVWVFPRGDHQANVGLGVLGSLCRAGMPQQLLSDFIGKKFPGAKMNEVHCGAVPMNRWLKPLVKDGVMIVGDAARQVDCATGAGLAFSFISGKMAGDVASQAFVESNEGRYCDFKRLKPYEKEWARYYGKQQRRSYGLKESMVSFPDSFLDEIAVSLSSISPEKMTVWRMFFKAFAKHPLQLFRVLKLFG
jgi:digeranylgeranylglycerophospholipid reductase